MLLCILLTLVFFSLLFVGLRLAVSRLSSTAASGGIATDAQSRQLLADCPHTPNCQGSNSSRENQRVDALDYNIETSDVIATLAEIVSTQAGANIELQQDNYLHATFKTPVMGYIDDVEFLTDEQHKQVQIRSASRLGRKDFGANAKRIKNLRALAATRLQ